MQSKCLCTINLPEYDNRFTITQGRFESVSWRTNAIRLQTCLWLCAYRAANDASPFYIGVIDHELCRLEGTRWVIVGTVLAHEMPHINLPGVVMPFPHNTRNPCTYGPPLDDAALIFHGLPSVAETLQRMTHLPRPLRDFSFEEVAQELKRRMDACAPRHNLCYGALYLDGSNPVCDATLHSLSQQVCTREITNIFAASFVSRYRCARHGCDNVAMERCHGPNHSRPAMLRAAWLAVAPQHARYVPFLEVMREFLRLHLSPDAEFSFMCHDCHINSAQAPAIAPA